MIKLSYRSEIDRHLGSCAAEVPVKFQSDWKSLNPNLAASRLHKILQYDVRPLSEYRPWSELMKNWVNWVSVISRAISIQVQYMLSYQDRISYDKDKTAMIYTLYIMGVTVPKKMAMIF